MDNMSDVMKMFSDKLGGDPAKLNSIFNMIQSSNNTTSSNSSSSNSSFEMPDMETILKIKKVMEQMNDTSNDPGIALLTSLKPYLRENKKSKVDQYIKMISISKAMSIFNDLGGDSK